MNTFAITPAQHLAIRDAVVSSAVGDELILLDLESGVYHSLNAGGTPIWIALERGLGYEEIVAGLVQEYDVSSDRAAVDVAEFLNCLIGLGLVHHQ